MTVSLRNTSGEPRSLGLPGPYGARLVDADELIHVEGDIAKDSPDDAYVIGDGSDARAYPKSLWTHVGGSPKAKADVPAPSKDGVES